MADIERLDNVAVCGENSVPLLAIRMDGSFPLFLKNNLFSFFNENDRFSFFESSKESFFFENFSFLKTFVFFKI